MTFEELTALKERHYHQLTGIPGVTAIGVGLLEDAAGELTQELGLILYHRAPGPIAEGGSDDDAGRRAAAGAGRILRPPERGGARTARARDGMEGSPQTPL